MRALNLSKNDIYSLNHYSVLASYFPSLSNLCLSENRITYVNELDSLTGLASLEELILKGNPLAPRTIWPLKELELYYDKLLKKFKGLRILDSVSLATYRMAPLPVPIRPSFFDTPDTQRLSLAYLEKYFQALDAASRNMHHLEAFYHESAKFSMTNTFFAKGSDRSSAAFASALAIEYARVNGHSPAMLGSGAPAPIVTLNGSPAIASYMVTLPSTRHDYASVLMDGWQSCPGQATDSGLPEIYILLSGSFMVAEGVGREYLRSLTLVPPSGPESKSTLAGLPASIYQDQWFILLPHEEGVGVGATTSSTAAPAEVPEFANLTPVKKVIAKEFSVSTGLTPSFTLQCLEQNKWVVEDAYKAYRILKVRIERCMTCLIDRSSSFFVCFRVKANFQARLLYDFDVAVLLFSCDKRNTERMGNRESERE